MTLPLFGTATLCHGFDSGHARSVARLQSLGLGDLRNASDFVVVRTGEDMRRAVEGDHNSIFIINDSPVEILSTEAFSGRAIGVPSKFAYLAEGDIIGIHSPSRKFRTLFRRSSRHDSFLVTERCNNYCLMCSQPPKDIDDRWILDEIRKSLHLVDKATPTLTFTGGEPLSDWVDFISVLAECRDQLPRTAVQVLTNGRAFSRSEIVDAWRELNPPSLIAAIPVYSAVDHLHDYVVQARGAFDETILGILKLKDTRAAS